MMVWSRKTYDRPKPSRQRREERAKGSPKESNSYNPYQHLNWMLLDIFSRSQLLTMETEDCDLTEKNKLLCIHF